MPQRGVTEVEVMAVLEGGQAVAAQGSRRARGLVFPHAKEWAGRFYDEKKVKVVYIEEEDEIIVVTVLAYYGRWS
jgi:hypothetical protein